jgi:GNAT superfamily N-acetyltransferase
MAPRWTGIYKGSAESITTSSRAFLFSEIVAYIDTFDHLVVRPAIGADRHSLAKLCSRARAEAPWAMGAVDCSTLFNGCNSMFSDWPTGRYLTIVAASAAAIVGCCSLEYRIRGDQRRAEFSALFVDSNWRRLGIGSQIVRKAVSLIIHHDSHAEITLRSPRFEPLVSFYRRCGFASISRSTPKIWSNYDWLPATVMRYGAVPQRQLTRSSTSSMLVSARQFGVGNRKPRQASLPGPLDQSMNL